MSLVAASILPILAAFACFAAIIVTRRMLRGYPAVQVGDAHRVFDVVRHAAPMLAACITYNYAVTSRADPLLELLAATMILVALAIAVYRVTQRLEAQKAASRSLKH